MIKWLKVPRPTALQRFLKAVVSSRILQWCGRALRWSVMTTGIITMLFGLVVIGVVMIEKPSHPKIEPGTILTMTIGGHYRDMDHSDNYLSFVGQDLRVVRTLVATLHRAARDYRIAGVVARLDDFSMGLANIQEVREAIAAVRHAGKMTLVYADTLESMKSYYLASSFEHVWLQPMGEVRLLGLASEKPFLRKALDHLAVEPKFFKRKEYKSGPDMFTESHPTRHDRNADEALLAALMRQMVRGIAEQRGLATEEINQLIHRGIFSDQEAHAARLIDRIAAVADVKPYVLDMLADVGDAAPDDAQKSAQGENKDAQCSENAGDTPDASTAEDAGDADAASDDDALQLTPTYLREGSWPVPFRIMHARHQPEKTAQNAAQKSNAQGPSTSHATEAAASHQAHSKEEKPGHDNPVSPAVNEDQVRKSDDNPDQDSAAKDDADDHLEEENACSAHDGDQRFVTLEGYARTVDDEDDDLYDPPSDGVIALIGASGDIVRSGDLDDSVLQRHMIGGYAVARWITKAADDCNVKAIVLRLDTGGGSVTASETIRQAVLAARKRKPVIVSMANVTASGGYWIASAADAIVAAPGTITGSIGVFGGKFVTAKFWERLGIHWGTTVMGPHADMDSSTRDYTAAERALIDRSMDTIYDAFVGRVAEGRKLDPQHVEACARGRVWSGEDARTLGLVDVLGGVEVALQQARKACKHPKAPAVTWPEPQGLVGTVVSLAKGESQDKPWLTSGRVFQALLQSIGVPTSWVHTLQVLMAASEPPQTLKNPDLPNLLIP